MYFKLRVKIFLWPCEEYRNKEEIETQKDYPAAEKSCLRKTGTLFYER